MLDVTEWLLVSAMAQVFAAFVAFLAARIAEPVVEFANMAASCGVMLIAFNSASERFEKMQTSEFAAVFWFSYVSMLRYLQHKNKILEFVRTFRDIIFLMSGMGQPAHIKLFMCASFATNVLELLMFSRLPSATKKALRRLRWIGNVTVPAIAALHAVAHGLPAVGFAGAAAAGWFAEKIRRRQRPL